MKLSRQRISTARTVIRQQNYPWYIAGNVPKANCVAAYQPIGAKSLALSYKNIANPGTNDASLGVAPSWDGEIGWTFNATSAYLKTGVISQGGHTIIIGFRNASYDTPSVLVGGRVTAANGMFIQPWYSSKVNYSNNNTVAVSPQLVNGVLAISGANGYRNGTKEVTTLTLNTNTLYENYIGGLNTAGTAGNLWPGEVFAASFYNTTLSDRQIMAISTAMNNLLTRYALSSLSGSTGNYATIGNLLEYEYTQPWSCGVSFRMDVATGVYSLFFSNVPPPSDGAYPGYEFWVDDIGHLRVRIIHNIATSNNIDVYGSTNVQDGNPHRAWATYDGSGTAGGVKIYLDGVLETLTLYRDALNGSIIATGQNFYVTTQHGYESTFYFRGRMRNFVLDNVVRDVNYIQAHSDPYIAPTPEAGRQLLLKMNEGSGLTVHDTSGNGRDATLSSSSMWYQSV